MRMRCLAVCTGFLLAAVPAWAQEPTPTCLGQKATIVGTEEPDRITAPNQTGDIKNVIVSLGGDDVVFGGSRRDIICGGDGDDSLDGGRGENRLIGGPGDDTLVVGNFDYVHYNDSAAGIQFDGDSASGEGSDTIVGEPEGVVGSAFGDEMTVSFSLQLRTGPGDDSVRLTGAANSGVRTGSGEDEILAGEGPDYILGGSGRDVVRGGSGADHVDGGDGHDLVLGGSGDDKLFGRGGNDRLNGHDGDDSLSGGSGYDMCIDGESFRSCAEKRDA